MSVIVLDLTEAASSFAESALPDERRHCYFESDLPEILVVGMAITAMCGMQTVIADQPVNPSAACDECEIMLRLI